MFLFKWPCRFPILPFPFLQTPGSRQLNRCSDIGTKCNMNWDFRQRLLQTFIGLGKGGRLSLSLGFTYYLQTLSFSLFGKELGKRSLVPPSPFHPPRKVYLTWLQVSGEVLRTLGCVLQAEWRSWYEEKPQIPFPLERGGTAPDGGCLVNKPGCHWNDITMEWFYRECNCIIKN